MRKYTASPPDDHHDQQHTGTRLGRHGIALIWLAQGKVGRPLSPYPHAETFTAAIDLEFELDSLEPLHFIMRPLLERLVERLDLRSFVASDIILILGLSGHGRDSRRIAVSAPANDPRVLLTLINLSLTTSPPQAAVASTQLEIEPCLSRLAQADLFLPPLTVLQNNNFPSHCASVGRRGLFNVTVDLPRCVILQCATT